MLKYTVKKPSVDGLIDFLYRKIVNLASGKIYTSYAMASKDGFDKSKIPDGVGLQKQPTT